jgi:hypothetical protein
MWRIARGRRFAQSYISVSSQGRYVIISFSTCLQIVVCHFSTPRTDTADGQQSGWRLAMLTIYGSDIRP